MKYIPLTKLVNGYEPVRIWLNPQCVAYVQQRLVTRGRGEEPGGSWIYLVGDDSLVVQESPEQVLAVLSPHTPVAPPSRRTFASDVEFERERAGAECG